MSEDELEHPSYIYPTDYTYELPRIISETYERTPSQVSEILNEVRKGDASFCEGLGYDHLTEEWLENEEVYGFLYKIDKTQELIGFAIFFVNKIKENEKITLKGKTYTGGTYYVEGLQRCSGLKGIGRAIQSDIEDFAKQNNIPFIKIQSTTLDQGEQYYKKQFHYVKENKNSNSNSVKLYKVVEGGRRKTRNISRKKLLKKTRKSKK